MRDFICEDGQKLLLSESKLKPHYAITNCICDLLMRNYSLHEMSVLLCIRKINFINSKYSWSIVESLWCLLHNIEWVNMSQMDLLIASVHPIKGSRKESLAPQCTVRTCNCGKFKKNGILPCPLFWGNNRTIL
jgi:hypothetical protein